MGVISPSNNLANTQCRDQIADTLSWLERQDVPYVIFRGYENLPDSPWPRDIDVLFAVERSNDIRQGLRDNGYVVSDAWREGLGGFTALWYGSEDGIYVMFHFVPQLLYGDYALKLHRFPTEVGVLDRRRLHNGAYVPDYTDELALLIIRGIIDDKGFISSYRDRINDLINAADRQRLIEVVSPIVGGLSEALWTDAKEHNFERLRSYAPLLRHALAIANGSGYRRRKVLNTIRRIRQRATSVAQFRPRGPTIALIGIDGVGKSTIADLLTSEISRFNPVKRVYMGFGVEAMAAEGHLRRTHPRQISGRLRSKILLGAGRQLKFPVWRHTLQWKRFLSTWRHRRRGGVVIYDRYVYDQTIEIQRVGAIPLLEKLFALVSLRIFPKPDFTFLLDLSPDVSYARKPEGDKTKLTSRRTAYIDLVQKVKSIKVVSTDQDPQAVSRAIMSEVWMHTSR